MNKKTVLKIDTSKTDETTIWLGEDEFRVAQGKSSQQLLPLITKAMKKKKLVWTDLTAIEIVPGPGSFTGLRVGFAVANTLSWVLGIPVNGQTPPLTPNYEPSAKR